MNKFQIFALIILSLISTSSCQRTTTVKVGFLLPNLVGERYQKEQAFFKDKVTALGGEALFASADYSDQLQIKQARDLIGQGVKVLVINAVNMNTAATIVREAHSAGIGVIAYDRLIRNADVDYYISFDNVKVGKMMAEYITRIKPEGNYLLLGGDKADLNAVLVKDGQMQVLSGPIHEGKINIGYDIYVEDWSTENAYMEVKRYLDLAGKAPDAILASNDEMAKGSAMALNEQGISGVLISGQDAELQSCRNIINDRQTMTIYKPLKVLAEKAAEVSFKMASGQPLEKTSSTMNNGFKEVPSILMEPVVVDKDNIRNTIVADGFYSESQLYN
jgi:D-xylose transport system substrate-binding protein